MREPILKWTVFPDQRAQTKTEHEGDWAALVEHLRNVGTFASKQDCPWLKCATFGNTPSARKCLRTDANLYLVYAVEIDYDAGLISIDKARELFEAAGVKGAFYPSGSSTPAHPKWRGIFPLSRPHSPTVRAAFVARAGGVLGVTDPDSFTVLEGVYGTR